MIGTEYNWLVTSVRSARGLSVRLVHGSLLTLAVGAFCLASALLTSGPVLTPAPAVAAPSAVVIKETAESELPRAFLRLWILVPYLLPQH